MLRPKVKEYFDVFPMGTGDRYQVRGTEYVSVLKGVTVGQIFGLLLPLLNGEYTTGELVEKLSDVAPPATILAFIKKLGESGILVDADVDNNGLPAEQKEFYASQMAFFEIAGPETRGAECQKALLRSKISIVGGGELAVRIAAECGAAGVGTISTLNLDFDLPSMPAVSQVQFENATLAFNDDEALERLLTRDKPSLLVLALDRAEPEDLERINGISIQLGLPLLHSRISGTQGIVGPLVLPGKTACLKCHHLRITRNFEFFDEYVEWENWVRREGHRRSATARIGPFAGIVAAMAALEIVKRLSSFHEPELYGKFLTVDALTMEVIRHEVLRIPRCPACGKTRGRPSFSPWLQQGKK